MNELDSCVQQFGLTSKYGTYFWFTEDTNARLVSSAVPVCRSLIALPAVIMMEQHLIHGDLMTPPLRIGL